MTESQVSALSVQGNCKSPTVPSYIKKNVTLHVNTNQDKTLSHDTISQKNPNNYLCGKVKIKLPI